MTLVKEIAEELRTLRRLSGPLVDSKLAHAPLILKGLGRGDSVVAMQRLVLIVNQYQADRDIVAAMASFGYTGDGATVLDRLEDFASSQGVDARTVRRWSDEGIKKLASLILSESPWIDPWISLGLSQESSTQLLVAVRVYAPHRLAMRRPELMIGKEPFRLRLRTIATTEPDVDLYESDEVEILLNEASNSVTIQLIWNGEIQPTFILTSRMLGPELSVRSQLLLYSLQLSVLPSEQLRVADVGASIRQLPERT